MRLTKYLAAATALALSTAPAMADTTANPASTLSLSAPSRAHSSSKHHDDLLGGGLIIAVIAAAAVVAGVVVVANNSSSSSN